MRMSDLVSQVRTMTSGAHVDRLNVLAQDWTPDQDTIYLKYPVGELHDGIVVSAGLMTWQVIGKPDVNGMSATILPAPTGSSATAVEAGSIIRIAPRHTDQTIFTLLNHEIVAMSSPMSGLYRPAVWVERVNPANDVYTVPPEMSDIQGVISVTLQRIGFSGNYSVRDYTFQRHADGTNSVIRIRSYPYDGEITFVGRRPFRQATFLYDEPTGVCGLSASMEDIPVLGAAGMLMLADEGRRVNLTAQGSPRLKDEIPPTSIASQARELLRQRDQRINDEASALNRLYSTRSNNMAFTADVWNEGYW